MNLTPRTVPAPKAVARPRNRAERRAMGDYGGRPNAYHYMGRHTRLKSHPDLGLYALRLRRILALAGR